MRGSRGTAAAGVCAALASIALGAPGSAASAPQRHKPRQVNVALTGSMAITWVGSPAAGCAAEGVCGVSGSVEIHLGNTSSSSSGGPAQLEVSDDSAVARVQTTAADGTVVTCADLVPVDFALAVRRTGGAPHTTIDAPTSLALPSAGHCAGPTGRDLSRLSLPARPFGAHGYDMSGTSSFTGGPFQVTAFSSVRAHITFGSNGGPLPFGGGFFSGSGGSRSASPVKARPALEESAAVVYRMTGIRGSLTTAFAGLAPPVCAALGACGAAGRLMQSFTTRGRLTFSGSRIVARRVGRTAALADLRHGRLRLFDDFSAAPITVTTNEAITQSDGLACRDTSTMRLGSTSGRIRGTTADELLLSPGAGLFPGGALDPFRTRCPGPSALDIVGPRGAPMATATVTAGELGDRQLTVVFHSGGSFTGSAYRGQRSGSVALFLTLVSRRGVTRRVKVFPGEPTFPIP
jgi:hypothetical protein